MKYVAIAAGILLGACFLFASVPVLFNVHLELKPPPEGSPTDHFMRAFAMTGYIKFVKTFEFVGALLVMIPRVRNLGLLLLGPVIVNILAFHIFVDDPNNMRDPVHIVMVSIIVVCSLYLVWDGRKKFSALVN
jgi:hypothetical protein